MKQVSEVYRGVAIIASFPLLNDEKLKAKGMIDNEMRKLDYLPLENMGFCNDGSRFFAIDFDETFPYIKEMKEEEMNNESVIVEEIGETMSADEYISQVESGELAQKKAKISTPKSPLFELLPQVFKGNGKVRKHPYNAKAKTSEIRNIIREAAKLSMMTSVMLVIPAGVICLSSDFKKLCVNSKGESTYDLVLEEMIMNGWTLRGVQMTSNDFANASEE